MKVSEERSVLMKQLSELREDEIEEFEKVLAKEKERAKKANEVLKKTFYSLRKSMLLFSLCPYKFTFDFMQDKNQRKGYKELLSRSKKCVQDGQGIASISKSFTGGIDLSPDLNRILDDISKVTSHVANNPEKRISYLSGHHPVLAPTRVRRTQTKKNMSRKNCPEQTKDSTTLEQSATVII